MDRLADLGHDLMGSVLEGFDAKTIERMIGELAHAKENLKIAIANKGSHKPAAKPAAAA